MILQCPILPRLCTYYIMHQEHVARQRNDTAVIIGDSIIKGLHNDLLSRATQRRVTVRSFPGASSSDMKHYLQPSLQLKPSEIILHAGTNDLRDSSSCAVAEKLVDSGKPHFFVLSKHLSHNLSLCLYFYNDYIVL